MKSITGRFISPAFFFVLMFGTLELATQRGWVSAQLIPPLSQVLKTIYDMRMEFGTAFRETFTSVVLGLLISVGLGTVMAFTFSLSSFLRQAILPFAIFFQTVPIIAIAPLLVIYFGFGAPTVITSATIVSIFPVIANTLIGLESVEPTWLDLFKLYHANRWQILFKLRLPSAYTSIYSGIKIACGLSVIGAIAGEFVAGGGLGALIDSARTQQRTDIVYGCLLLLSLMGLILVGLLRFLHLAIQKHKPYGLKLKD